MYEKRQYRYNHNNDLKIYNICIKETDLYIGCDMDLQSIALSKVRKARSIVQKYIEKNKYFYTSLVPLENDESADKFIKAMIYAGQIADTGPFAAVAGAVSQYVGEELKKHTDEVIVENGGDIYISSKKDRYIGVYAGESKLSDKFKILLKKERFPIGICTSSGTVGHSFSKGKADAVVVISKDVSIADSVATATCNMISSKEDIDRALNWAINKESIEGVLVIIGENIGAIGDIELA